MATRRRSRDGRSSAKAKRGKQADIRGGLHVEAASLGRTPLQRQKLAEAAKRVGLRFPEPFFWTTDRLDAIANAVPDYGVESLDARPLAILDPGESSIDFVVDGDSWFNHPFLLDVLDWFNASNVSFAGSFVPGRRLIEMVRAKRYVAPLQAFNVRAVLLSGGGNDLISWGRVTEAPSTLFIRRSDSNRPSDYIDSAELARAMTTLAGYLAEFVKDVRTIKADTPVITHFYDRLEPRHYRLPAPLDIFDPGEWVNPQLDALGVPADPGLRKAIAAILIDAANEQYEKACNQLGVIFVDLRGTVRGRWFDEIHPNDAAFKEVANKLSAAAPPRQGR